MSKYPARTFKDTFWSKKRVEYNITVRELAQMLKCSRATAGAYLTGFMLPDDDTIKTLCDFFDVDYIVGQREFNNAHKHYDVEHNRVVKAKATSSKKVTQEEVKTVEADKESTVDNSAKYEAIKDLVYGKIPRKMFSEIENIPVDKLEETIYGNVNFAVYKTVERILSDDIVRVENFDSQWNI